MPMAGIEDEVEENGLDTNKKLAQVGGSWNTAHKGRPLLGKQGDGHLPSGQVLGSQLQRQERVSCLNPTPTHEVDLILYR